ncbi:hypothetical protein C8Q69DRAFT_279932 [Paecilomyces variotii]|uniref:Secreted protein n=1 Tax=Byssochlamys spectabilis TaxID=264951 RepID=A0A443HTB3_BYSSP|nr:hypothetical protein C8Q69DRAFT_279932 [Paecilomyces variotii]RWQ95058.1 hypothetical protein C8Q69DRAFT_279932 [Paecilomyces variotii]
MTIDFSFFSAYLFAVFCVRGRGVQKAGRYKIRGCRHDNRGVVSDNATGKGYIVKRRNVYQPSGSLFRGIEKGVKQREEEREEKSKRREKRPTRAGPAIQMVWVSGPKKDHGLWGCWRLFRRGKWISSVAASW